MNLRCLNVAQLIKLQDYISRYQTDIYRYPGQYIRLKKENWKKLHYIWKNQSSNSSYQSMYDNRNYEEEPQGIFDKFFKKNEKSESSWNLPTNMQPTLPKQENDLKKYFLDGIFPFQLKWASSTIRETSFLDREYHYDQKLRYYLQRFPDTFLVMYYPIFQMKKAQMEGEIIIITPIAVYCITMIEQGPSKSFIATSDRTWQVEENQIRTNFLSPLISLKRTAKLVSSILDANQVDFPVKRIVLSRTNPIIFDEEPFNTEFIGLTQYESWFEKMRRLSSPLKRLQLKAAEVLLVHCQTTSVKRPEWDDDDFNTFRTNEYFE